MAERMTYLLVDGENIDATLGTSILGRRPRPEERPRWDRLLEWAERAFDQDVTGLFFLAASTELPTSFVQALLAIGFKPIPLSGEGKVVDIAIQRTAEALVDRPADVVLVSHDGDFVDQVSALCDGSRQVGVVGFGEFVNSQFRNLPGLRILDLEYDIGAFNSSLPRIRIIPIDQFDPLEFL
jgi:putative heme uptake system protein